MSELSFYRVIAEHLALCERNKRLGRTMPLDQYRDNCSDIADGSLSREAEPFSEEGPSTQVRGVPRRDPDSWWETKDGECPPPPLGWITAY